MGVLAAQTMLRRMSGDYNNNDSGIKNDAVIATKGSASRWMSRRPPKKNWIRHFFANEETPPSHEEFPPIFNCSPQSAVTQQTPLSNGPTRGPQKQSNPVIVAAQLPPTPTPTPTVTPTATPTATPTPTPIPVQSTPPQNQIPPLQPHQPVRQTATSPYPSDSGSPLHSQDEEHGSEIRRRAGSGTREVHNKLEKNRRAHLKECFEMLKRQLPTYQEEKKFSNLAILHAALKYIQTLKRKELEAEHEMEKLAREKIAAQQRLSELRKDLGGWDGLPPMPALPMLQTPDSVPKRSPSSTAASPTSTSTASEREERMIIDEEDLSNSGRSDEPSASLHRGSPTDFGGPSTLPGRTYAGAGARNGASRENFLPLEPADVVRSSPIAVSSATPVDGPRSPGVTSVFRLPALTAATPTLAPVAAYTTTKVTIPNNGTSTPPSGPVPATNNSNNISRSCSPSTITYTTSVPVPIPMPVSVPVQVTGHPSAVSSPNGAPTGNGTGTPVATGGATPPLLQPVTLPIGPHHIQLTSTQMVNNGRWVLASPGVHVIPGDPLTIALPQAVSAANGDPPLITTRPRDLPSDLRVPSSGSAPSTGEVSATAAISVPAISVNKMVTAGVAIFNERQLCKPETASRSQEAAIIRGAKAHITGDHNGHMLTTALPPRLAPTTAITHVVTPVPGMTGTLGRPINAIPRQLSAAHHTVSPIAVSPVITQGSPVTHILTTSSQLGKVMATPLLKTVAQVPMVGSTYATLVKPMVVVSTASTTVPQASSSQAPPHSG